MLAARLFFLLCWKQYSDLAASGKALGVKGAHGIGRGGPDAKAFTAWALVGIPLAWGVWKTLENAAKIFQ